MGLGQKDPVSVCQSFMSSWIDFTMAVAYRKKKKLKSNMLLSCLFSVMFISIINVNRVLNIASLEILIAADD